MKFRCRFFDVHDQELIQNAKISGRPEHVAQAIAVGVAGFKERLLALPGGFPIVDGRPHLLLSAKAKGNFFDHYVVSLALQEVADATGKVVTILYEGEKVVTDKPSCPDVEFS